MRSLLGLIFSGVLLYVAFGTGWSGDSRAERLDDLRESGVRATGTVTAVEEVERTQRTGGRRSRRNATYTVTCPEITYRVAGEKHVLVERSDCDRLEVGDEVTVLYEEGAPYNAMLDSDRPYEEARSWDRSTWILGGAGVVFGLGSLLGIVMRVSRWRQRRSGAVAAG